MNTRASFSTLGVVLSAMRAPPVYGQQGKGAAGVKSLGNTDLHVYLRSLRYINVAVRYITFMSKVVICMHVSGR